MRGEKNMMVRGTAFIIRHLAAISLVFVVALLFGSIHFFASRLIPADTAYHPVTEALNFDEGADYAVRAASVFYRYDLLVGDVVLKENFSSPAFLPILNPLLIAGAGRIAGSLDGGFILAKIILPAVSFFFVYLLGFEILGSRLAAVLLAVIFLFFPQFALFPSANSLSWGSELQLYFARFEYPLVTFPFFAAALYLIARVLKRNERGMYLIAGVAVGFLFYTYLYDWVYVFTGLFILAAFLFFMRDRQGIIKILKIIAVAGIASLPYWLNFFAIRASASFGDLMLRIGAEFSHRFRFDIVWPSYIRAITLAGLVWLSNRKKQPKMVAYVSAFALPILFLLNIQVLTGFVPHPDHWHRTTFLMLAVAVFAIVLPFVARFKVKKILVVVLVAFLTGYLFGYAFGIQYLRAPIVAKAATINRDYEEVYQWFLREQPKSIVLSLSSVTNNELILRSGVWTFLPNGFNTIVSNTEIIERAKISAAIYRLTEIAFINFLETNNQYLFVDVYRVDKTFNSYFKVVERKISPDILNNLVVDYNNYSPDSGQSKFLKPNFVIFGPRERNLGAKLPLAMPAKLMYTFGAVSIYQI